MKKGILFILCLLMTLAMSFSSCAHRSGPKHQQCNSIDTVDVVQIVNELLSSSTNPTFTTVTDAVCEYEVSVNSFKRDSVFRNMSEQTVANVAHVLLYKANYCSKQSIVDEYLSNKRIYDNILQQPVKQAPDTIMAALQDDSPKTIPRTGVNRQSLNQKNLNYEQARYKNWSLGNCH